MWSLLKLLSLESRPGIGKSFFCIEKGLFSPLATIHMRFILASLLWNVVGFFDMKPTTHCGKCLGLPLPGISPLCFSLVTLEQSSNHHVHVLTCLLLWWLPPQLQVLAVTLDLLITLGWQVLVCLQLSNGYIKIQWLPICPIFPCKKDENNKI